MADYKPHPYAELFPLDEGKPLWEMSDDIKLNGLQVPIVLYEGKVLDGRRRLLACLRAGVEPKYKKFAGGDDAALAFVVSHNLHRRHLDTSDRAMVAAKIATMRHGGNNSKTSTISNAPEASGINAACSQAEAAELLNVSERSVRNAKSVIDHGTPELKKAVEQHVVSVTAAANVAKESPAVQRAAVKEAASSFCERCQRVGPVKGCPACAALKSPGKPTNGTPKAPKPGSVKFDWNASDKAFGAVARWPDALASAYPGEKQSSEYKRIIDLLTEVGEVRARWHKRLKKIKE